MDKEIEKELLPSTLEVDENKAIGSAAIEETSNNNNPASKQEAPSSVLESKPNFNAIYDELHYKFPEIINMEKPVLLAVGIRKEISKKIGIYSVILKKWVAWYCRKSNYYALHKQGAIRFNLDGTEAGIVTAQHQKKMDKKLERTKKYKLSVKNQSKNPGNGGTTI